MKPMLDGLIIDNFAGGGGASSGLEEAFGRPVDFAINHDAEAVAMHLANHPETKHICQSVWKADPLEVTGGKKVALAWFSPDCKHFSKAKGGRPVEKGIRDLAWVVVHWARRVKPTVIMLENVEEFRQWCPIGLDGRPVTDEQALEQMDLLAMPQAPVVRVGKRKKLKPNGVTFELWCAALRKAGYKIEFKELRGCDYGAPTIRKRLFVIARCDGRPIVWPQPTHRPVGAKAFERWSRNLVEHGFEAPSALLPVYLTAASDVIDWSIPCPSIFERDRPLADNTLRRIAAGIMRFVVNNPKPFIVPVCNSGWGNQARSADEPAPTITTAKGGEYAVVTPILDRQFGRGGAAPVDEPARTETERLHTALISPVLVHTAHGDKDKSGKRRGRGEVDPLNPMPTATTTGSLAVAMATLIHRGNGERDGQAPRAMDAEKPLGTAVASGIKHGVVEATMLPVDRSTEVAAFMAQHNSDAAGQPRTGRPVEEPASTIVHRGTQQQVVVAHLEQANTGMVGHHPEKPVSTIVGKGCTQRLVTSHLMKYRGTCAHGQPTDEPAPTVTSGGTHVAEVQAFLLKYYGTGAIGSEADQPVHSATAKARFGLVTVTIAGEEYVIVDIGMRMLTARELARAQGFPDSYILDPWLERVSKRGKVTRYRLPKTSQVRMIGNSVNRQVACALAAANCNEPEAREEAQAA